MRITIYCHTHIASGKRYVGQALRWMARWKAHVRDSRRPQKRFPFQEAIREFGPEAFSHDVLEVCDSQDAANRAETRWIQELGTRYPNGYNLDGGGGFQRHPITIEKHRQALKRNAARLTPEQHREWSLRLIANLTPEQKAARSAWMRTLGSNITEERRRAIGESNRSFWNSLTVEQKNEINRKRVAARTPAQREAHLERLRKRNAENAARRGPKPPPPPKLTADERGERIRAARRAMTPERRSEIARAAVAGRTPAGHAEIVRRSWENLTPEQREARGSLVSAGHMAKSEDERSAPALERWARTPTEERRRHVQAANASLTAEQRSQNARAAYAARTEEQRSEAARKGAATRAAKFVAKGCAIVGCARKYEARGLCATHYMAARRATQGR